MSNKVVWLLEAFDALSEEDKRRFAAEVVRRTLPLDSGAVEEAKDAVDERAG